VALGAVLGQQRFGAAVVRLAHRRLHADLGGRAHEHLVRDAVVGRQRLQRRRVDRTLAPLVDDERRLDADALEPIEGLLRIFDFVDRHFARHPHLRKLLAFESLEEARHLARSARIPQMATPLLDTMRQLLARGVADGAVRAGVDALHLYVATVSLSCCGRAHAHTLSRIFDRDLFQASRQEAHRRLGRQMWEACLTRCRPWVHAQGDAFAGASGW
jgi:hypothetical protein